MQADGANRSKGKVNGRDGLQDSQIEGQTFGIRERSCDMNGESEREWMEKGAQQCDSKDGAPTATMQGVFAWPLLISRVNERMDLRQPGK